MTEPMTPEHLRRAAAALRRDHPIAAPIAIDEEIGELLADVLDQAARRAEIGQCDAMPHPCNHCAELDWGAVGLDVIARILLGEEVPNAR
jgi:hypothetical protein